MTRAKHARTTTTGRKLAAGALSVPMALTMAGTAAATETVPVETAAAASSSAAALAHDALAAKPAELPAKSAAPKAEAVVEAPETETETEIVEAEVVVAKGFVEPARPESSNSAAELSLVADCTTPGTTTVTVSSDKDISNVKVYYADGTKDERSLSGREYTGTFTGDVVRVTAKSGSTEVEDDVTCVTPDGQEEPAPQTPVTPVPTTPIGGGNGGAGSNNGGSNSEADLDLDVTCVEGGVQVVVGSDKDISNVKVYYADGSMDEVSLDGYEYDETFLGDVIKVTTKSGTTEVEVLAEDFAACVVNPDGETPTTPVTPETPTTPTTPETPANPETPETPANPETPGNPIGGGDGGAGTGTPPVVTPPSQGGTPVVEVPVVNTPVVPVLPISGQPAPAAGSGVVNTGASAPQAFAPTFGAGASTASPTALPYTGSTTSLLLALGTGLVVVGGGLALSGRRETVTAAV